MKKVIIALLAMVSFGYCAICLRFNDDVWALIPMIAQGAILALTVGKEFVKASKSDE